jgi:hypothetical protein
MMAANFDGDIAKNLGQYEHKKFAYLAASLRHSASLLNSLFSSHPASLLSVANSLLVIYAVQLLS